MFLQSAGQSFRVVGGAVGLLIISVFVGGCGVSREPAFERVTDCSTRVYYNRFDEGPPGREWSIGQVSYTKKGNRPYLGDFVPGKPVTLRVGGLPGHKLVRITFDLFLQRSWDGSSPIWGWTRWDMKLGDGRSLLHTSFANCGFWSDNNEQAFPDAYPARPHPAWTGAAENQTLGAIQSWGGPERTFDASSVYHFAFTFPHTGDDVLFRFFSSTKGDQKKYFGLTNVCVETIAEYPKHSEHEFERMWSDLGSARPEAFFKARWELIASGEAAALFVERHMHENIDLSPEDISGLIERLRTSADGDFNANRLDELVIQGKGAAGPIDKALAGKDLTEGFRNYLVAAKGQLQQFPESATELRIRRARQVIQVIRGGGGGGE